MCILKYVFTYYLNADPTEWKRNIIQNKYIQIAREKIPQQKRKCCE